LAAELDALREESQAQRARFEDREAQRSQGLKASRARIVGLESLVEQAAASREAFQQSLAASRSRVAKLEGTLGEAQAFRQTLAAELEGLREENQAQQVRFREAEKQRGQELELANAEIAALNGLLGERPALPKYRTTRRLSFRRSPSKKAKRIRVLDPTTEFQVLDRSGPWLKARLNGTEGWLHSDYAKAIDSPSRVSSQTNLTAGLSTLAGSIRQLDDAEKQGAQVLEASRLQAAELEGALGVERSFRQALAAEFEALRKDNQAQRASFSEAEKQRAQALEARRSQIVKLDKTLEQERMARQTLIAGLDGMRVEIRAQAARFGDIETRSAQALEASQAQVTNLESSLQQEQDARQTLADELEALRDESRAQAARFGDIEKQRVLQTEASQARIAVLEGTLDQERVSRQTLIRQLEGLRKEIRAQSAQLGEAEKQRAGQLEAARSQIAALQGEFDQEKASRQTLVAEFERLNKEIQNQRVQLGEAEKKRARELRAARSQIDELEGKVVQEPAAKQTLVAELGPLRREPAVRQQDPVRLVQAGTRVEQHEKQLAALTADRPVSGVEPTIAQSSPLPKAPVAGSTEPVAFSRAPGVDAFVRAWANAWSRQAVDDYLAHYSEDFQPADGSSRAAWEALRRQRLTRPSFIEVKVTGMEIESLDANRARATFRQAYRADRYHDDVVKVLELARDGGRWWIVSELAR
jgi:hypothetical protein